MTVPGCLLCPRLLLTKQELRMSCVSYFLPCLNKRPWRKHLIMEVFILAHNLKMQSTIAVEVWEQELKAAG